MVFVWGVTVLRAALLNRRSPTALSCFLRVYRPLYFPNDHRWPYLSLFEERYGRKTRLVVASSTSFVLPLGAKAQSFHCSSSPHQTHFVGLWRGPCPKAALWNLAFYTGGWRGDVRRPYEFAQMQLTRFRPARRRAGGVRFARLRRKAKHHLFSAISLPKALLPPDSCLLHVTQWAQNTH